MLMDKKILKGKKLNMTQVFLENGKVIPVTVIETGDEVNSEVEEKKVAITGKSKGKGFTGVMKKWNFHGQQATRGQSNKPRAAGAIGSQTPGRVFKGKKMAGKHGNKKVTVKGLKIVKVDKDNKQFMVSGPVPGARNSDVIVRIL